MDRKKDRERETEKEKIRVDIYIFLEGFRTNTALMARLQPEVMTSTICRAFLRLLDILLESCTGVK